MYSFVSVLHFGRERVFSNDLSKEDFEEMVSYHLEMAKNQLFLHSLRNVPNDSSADRNLQHLYSSNTSLNQKSELLEERFLTPLGSGELRHQGKGAPEPKTPPKHFTTLNSTQSLLSYLELISFATADQTGGLGTKSDELHQFRKHITDTEKAEFVSAMSFILDLATAEIQKKQETSCFDATVALPSISVRDYLVRLTKYIPLTLDQCSLVLIYIDRLMAFSGIKLTPRNIHRILISRFVNNFKYSFLMFVLQLS
jgi:hypothetical protein